MGAPKNLGVDPFPDNISHFGTHGGHFGFYMCCDGAGIVVLQAVSSAPDAARLVFFLYSLERPTYQIFVFH